MTPFLQEIAKYYIEKHGRGLIDYCFVFPNKRAGVFFNHFLAVESQIAGYPLIHPEVMTISDLVIEITGDIEASRIEQLFLLYRCYRNVMERHKADDDDPVAIDFNRFQYWGDILINDFTDVDKYMVDSAQLFHNIEALREISANYLTPEQIDVIKRYWGEDKLPRQAAEFWNHAVHEIHRSKDNGEHNHKIVASFVKLWQVMDELYHAFNDELQSRQLAYQGMIYRRALEILRDMPAGELPYERYVFIGFNVLSTVEEKLFETLKAKGIADFFWDYASPAFDDSENHATRFLKKYVKEFASPADAAGIGHRIDHWPQIDIIGIPSVNGQPKVVAGILQRLFKNDRERRVGDNIDRELLSTAIVLPDEGLCMPIINSLPEGINDINVTMGYPLRDTAVASLVSRIVGMQLRAKVTSFENSFFKEDVINILSHPIIRSIDSATCDKIVKEINEKRLFNVPVSLLDNPIYETLGPLFVPVNESGSSREVFAYLKTLIHWLLDCVIKQHTIVEDNEDNSDEADEDRLNELRLSAAGAMEAGFLKHYLEAIDELQRMQRCHLGDLQVDLNDSTIFRMVERLMAGGSVAFEGRPLKGLQIMGMLETRALDFDNIIITSMNERIFPRKHFASSFIPPALRYGYGMATMEYQESISAYYFYRLISRAQHVYMLYDTRSQGAKSGEPSRYINQLRYLYNPPMMNISMAGYKLQVQDNPKVEMVLDKTRIEKLGKYVSPFSQLTLSASSINSYIDCRVRFALNYIEGYNDHNDPCDYIDDAMFGNIVHKVVERLYKSLQTGGRPVVIDRGVINKLRQPSVIEPEIRKAVNNLFLNKDKDDMTPLTGENELLGKMMLQLVRNMLDHELDDYDTFTFIDAEKKGNIRLKVSDRLTINLKYIIDRIDSVIGPDGRRVIRIIDYKTGVDDTVTTVDRMFVPYKKNMVMKRDKAILQLFIYSNAFVQDPDNASYFIDNPAIQPMLYKFKSIGSNEPPKPIVINDEPLYDFRQFNDEVMARLDEELFPLFNATDGDDYKLSIPDDDHVCGFCKFTTICRRKES
ncbi:MAG: PD-(D/E)XK nuclease family protein [Clostridiales bacterium]|nr:PD-(D/E)XK nuclease family protein [Clostridiales bacterium]